MTAGVRVVRGPDWKWGDQDGKCVGTVVRPFQSESYSTIQPGTVIVQWDGGTVGNYRTGKDGKFDLRILNSAPSGIKFPGINCDECGQKGIIGTRWKCSVCENFDLCDGCYHSDKHNINHRFLRYDCPQKVSEVPSRENSPKSEVLGIFPGATVVRRVEDWLYGRNDGGVGGMPGTVMENSSAQLLSGSLGSVTVLWENGELVEHSCGNNGVVAIKCITPAVGSSYYVDHLGVLRDDFVVRDQISSDEKPHNVVDLQLDFSVTRNARHLHIDGGDEPIYFAPFSAGDRVQVKLDVDVFRALQDGRHGGWNPEMELCIGVTGIVEGMSHAVVIVNYKGLEKRFFINPRALTKKRLEVGDHVRILPYEHQVRSLQRGFGGWAYKMREDLGKIAEVVGIRNGIKALVSVNGRPYIWTLNPKCCTVVDSDSTASSVSDDGDNDSDSESMMQMLHMMRIAPEFLQPNLLVQVAANDSVPLVKAIIDRFPTQIDERNCGKTALHMSCLRGHEETVRTLLDAGADGAATDDQGNTPVHYAVSRRDNAHILKILLAKGPWFDLVNFNMCSVLHVAVNKGHFSCVTTLVEHGCNVNVKDQVGDAPLHDAIRLGHGEIAEYLIKCERFNFAITNGAGFNVLHLAAINGDTFITEKIIEAAPQLVNQQKADGFTALHIACINGHRDVAEVLIEKGGAIIEIKTQKKKTPLMVAVQWAKFCAMELLILKGANPNASDMDGETCLHRILKLITYSQLGVRDTQGISAADLYDAPEIASIVAQLPSGIKDAAWVGVALFLVQHGANLGQPNSSGITPIDFMQDQTITNLLLETNHSSSHFQSGKHKTCHSIMVTG